jgi:hypothetical protein
MTEKQWLHDVTEVNLLEGYQVLVLFDDGTAGKVDFWEWAPFPGVLAPLAQPEVFAQLTLHPEHKTIMWPTAIPIDVDPVWLYCRANGLSLPDWTDLQASA